MRRKLQITITEGSRKTRTHNFLLPDLFKFSTRFDVVLIFSGLLLSVVPGIAHAFLFLIFGSTSESIIKFAEVLQNENTLNETVFNLRKNEMISSVRNFTFYNSILGFLILIGLYLSALLLSRASIHQIWNIRSAYFQSMLNKDISWYDINSSGDFSSRIVEDLGKIEQGMGDKLSLFAYSFSVVVSGLTLSLIKGWELTLVCAVAIPLSTLTISAISRLGAKLVKNELDAYANAGQIAEEVLSSIKTVVAFGGQKKELLRFKDHLVKARNNNIKRSFLRGISKGISWFLLLGTYGLSFWYGIKLIVREYGKLEDERLYSPSVILTVFLNVLKASYQLERMTPFLDIYASAKAASIKIFEIIENDPSINLSKGVGYKGEYIDGCLRFHNVYFNYASRPERKVLQYFNLDVRKGETVALVGNSGCGKSTCIQLLQRFYDPLSGNVFIDNLNLKKYDLSWLRSKIGVVEQKPILFATTIEENIRFGNTDASMEDVTLSAIKANAHEFICRLPKGYSTLVGEKGAQLSGGQKQRIAIARALIRRPSILLLDEGTSAPDTQSESLIQNTLDKACKNCTTIIIAHRLSTIRGVDRIIVIGEGVIIEEGTHSHLMQTKGAYYNLVMAEAAEEDEKLNEWSNIPLTNVDEIDVEPMPSVLNIDEGYNSDGLTKISASITMWNIFKLNKPELWSVVLGVTVAVLHGASIPIYSIAFGEVIGILSNSNIEVMKSEGETISLAFGILGLVAGFTLFLQTYLLGISGERLTLRVRMKMFEAIIKQEIAWFDDPENGVGSLCYKLSARASEIQGALGTPIGNIMNAVTCLGMAIIIGFYYEWRITLVNMSFIPLMFLLIYLEAVFVKSEASKTNNEIKCASNVLKYYD